MTQPMTKPTQPVTQQQTPTRIQEVSAVETDLFDLLERLEQSDVVPCRVHDAEIWFAQTPEDVEFAKALCGTCPARDACLSHALDSDAFWGIWGGELFEWGAIVPKKRPRGRPRKETVAA